MEEIFLAGLFEDLLEGVTGGGGFEEVGVAVTADGDEVEVSGVVETDQTLWHGVSLMEGWRKGIYP